jgi:MFS family permease
MARDAQDSPQSAETARPPRVTFLQILQNRAFRNLWLGQIISQIGDYFAFLAMMVIVTGFSTDQERTTLAVSGMMISLALPRLLFGMLAGVFVDRWDRRRTMLVSDLVRAGLTLLMIPAFMTQSLPAIYVLGFAMSAVGTLFNPAKSALIPRLVPENHLLAANSLSQTSMMLATLIGPALAGISFQFVGAGHQWFAFLIDSASFFVSAFAIWRVVVPPAPAAAAAPVTARSANMVEAVRQVGRELKEGLQAVVLNRSVALVTVVIGVAMLGAGAINVLWVVFLKQRFGFDTTELAGRVSILDIAMGVGMIASSILIGNFLAHVAPKWLIVVGLTGIGVAIGAYGYLPEYWLMAGSTLLIGVFNAPINAGVSTLVQLVVPNHQLGRVNGGLGTVIDAASLGSMSMAGVLGAALGIPMVFLLAGVLAIITGLMAWVLLPRVTMHTTAVQGSPGPHEAPAAVASVEEAQAA